MSIQVNDFQWEPGKNDAEYIKLLESSRDEWQKIAQKAIAKLKALSKAQEARVVTPTEAYTADFVYVEFEGIITPALRTSNEREGHCESYFATQQLGGEWMRWDDYDITWRCWTSRPTDEQRQAVKWK